MAGLTSEGIARKDDECKVDSFEAKGYVDNYDQIKDPGGDGPFSEPPTFKTIKVEKCYITDKKELPEESDEDAEDSSEETGEDTADKPSASEGESSSEENSEENPEEEESEAFAFCNGKPIAYVGLACTSPKATIYERKFNLDDEGYPVLEEAADGDVCVKWVGIYDDGSIKDIEEEKEEDKKPSSPTRPSRPTRPGGTGSGGTNPSKPKPDEPKLVKKKLVKDPTGKSKLKGKYSYTDTEKEVDKVEGIHVEEGSTFVFVDGAPLARKNDKITGGTIKEGSEDSFSQ